MNNISIERQDKCDHCLDELGKVEVSHSQNIIKVGKNMNQYQFTCPSCDNSWTCWFSKRKYDNDDYPNDK